MTDPLEHTKRIRSLIEEGRSEEAAELHNRHLKAEFEKARSGDVICLTDLMAAKEVLEEEKASRQGRARDV